MSTPHFSEQSCSQGGHAPEEVGSVSAPIRVGTPPTIQLTPRTIPPTPRTIPLRPILAKLIPATRLPVTSVVYAAVWIISLSILCCSALYVPTGSESQLFSSGSENDTAAEASREAVTVYCNNPAYAFVKCKVDPDNRKQWQTAGGQFGMGVFAYLDNNPTAYGITIYQNLGVQDDVGTVKLLDNHIVHPRQQRTIPVFIKILQEEKTNELELSSTDRTYSSLEKERRRARAFARKHLGPKYYDVITTDTGMSHLIHKHAYITRIIKGRAGSDLINSIMSSVEESLGSHMQRLVTAYQVDSLVSRDGLWRETHAAADFLIADAWLWILHTLNVFKASIGFLQSMWAKGFHHCDSHLGNFMFIAETIDDPHEAAALLRQGEIFAPNISDTVVLTSPAAVKCPISVFRLQPDRVQAIDFAFGINNLPRDDVLNPCLIYRSARNEDMFEVYRSFSLTGYFMGDISLMWTSVKETAASRYVFYPEMAKVHALLFDNLDSAISHMQNYFENLTPRLRDANAELNDCVENNHEFDDWEDENPEATPADRMSFPTTYAEHQCSVVSQKSAMRRLTRQLANEGAYLEQHVFPLVPRFAHVLSLAVAPTTRQHLQHPSLRGVAST